MNSTAMTVPLKRWTQDMFPLRCFCWCTAGVSSAGASSDLEGDRDPSGVEQPFVAGDFCRMLDMGVPKHPGQLSLLSHYVYAIASFANLLCLHNNFDIAKPGQGFPSPGH